MISFGVNAFKRTATHLRAASRWRNFFRLVNLKDAQEAHFFKDHIDGREAVSPRTAQLRFERIDYYRRAPRSGVTSDSPYMVWTGNTLQYTYQARGRVRFASASMTISHDLERLVEGPDSYWGITRLERHVVPQLDNWIQNGFDGRLGVGGLPIASAGR